MTPPRRNEPRGPGNDAAPTDSSRCLWSTTLSTQITSGRPNFFAVRAGQGAAPQPPGPSDRRRTGSPHLPGTSVTGHRGPARHRYPEYDTEFSRPLLRCRCIPGVLEGGTQLGHRGEGRDLPGALTGHVQENIEEKVAMNRVDAVQVDRCRPPRPRPAKPGVRCGRTGCSG